MAAIVLATIAWRSVAIASCQPLGWLAVIERVVLHELVQINLMNTNGWL